MYCKYCGSKIDADSTYCSGCGAKINIAAKVPPAKSSGADKAIGLQHPISTTASSKPVKEKEPVPDFDPTLGNIMAQFSPVGRVVFVLLCILMVLWVASLTVYIFYPEFINYFNTL